MLKTASLTPMEKEIIISKATEPAFSGIYDKSSGGTYICRNCGTALFTAASRFDSGSGWPSFDAEIASKVDKVVDQDGHRTEILCSACQAHLGHVFYGERYTDRNTRNCVNAATLDYVPIKISTDTEEAIVAAGCFWGVEYLFKKLTGVLTTVVGYTGGSVMQPTYEAVCNGKTAHTEALRIIYDPSLITYDDIIRYFFEIHDFTQTNGQGNDIGSQYLSRIYYFNDEQRDKAAQIIKLLIDKNFQVATKLEKVATFWSAEDYHQNYYGKNNGTPYCHFKKQIF